MSINGDELGAAQAAQVDEGQPDPQASPPVPKTATDLSLMPPRAKPPVMAASGPVLPIRPQSIEDCWRLAQFVVKGGIAPKGLNAEACVALIVHGSEVGIPAMAAIQSIALINGRPTLFGDGALGVIRASGKLEYIREVFSINKMEATCAIKRHGEPQLIRRFSKADAETALLWGRTGRQGEPTPWVTYPRRMLQMRARAFAMGDGFADVLKGFAIAEEQQDVPAKLAEEPVPTLAASA
jgi:hypothetical protein